MVRLGWSGFEDLLETVKSSPGYGETGCIVSFIGVVREESGEGSVERLHLGVDETTEGRLREIAGEVSRKYDVVNTLIYHNLDEVGRGEPVVYVLASARHREDAFKAVQEIIDRIKNEVHVDAWEVFKDGGK